MTALNKNSLGNINISAIDIEKEMARAKRRITDNYFGYTSIFLPLQLVADDSVGMMATDGKVVLYSPSGIQDMYNEVGLEETRFRLFAILLHEGLHVMWKHHIRRGDRDPDGWNIATDYVINYELVRILENDYGYRTLDMIRNMNALYDKQYGQMSAEKVFALLKKEKDEDGKTKYFKPQGGQQSGDDNQDGEELSADGFGGEVLDLPVDEDGEVGVSQSDIDQAIQEEDERITDAIIQADLIEKANGDGSGTGLMSNARKSAQQKPISWTDVLRDHLTSMFEGDERSYRRYERRYLAQDIYLPSKKPMESGTLAIGIDISGSVSLEERQIFVKNIQAITDEFPNIQTIKICYINSGVMTLNDDDDLYESKWDVFKCKEEDIVMREMSGGGTEVDPFFNLIDQTDHDETETPDVAIYFTDGYVYSGRDDVEYPVVWATTGTTDYAPKWAEVVEVDVYQ